MNPGDPKTLDAYRYADNNPVSYADPSGLRRTCASNASEEMTCAGSDANKGVDFHTGSTTTVNSHATSDQASGGTPHGTAGRGPFAPPLDDSYRPTMNGRVMCRRSLKSGPFSLVEI